MMIMFLICNIANTFFETFSATKYEDISVIIISHSRQGHANVFMDNQCTNFPEYQCYYISRTTQNYVSL